MRCALLLVLVTLFAAACSGGDDADDSSTPAPLLPADYASSYAEVRGCRKSGDHDLNYIRVLADPAALAPYQSRTAPFPDGAVVVKEEFDFADDTCTGPILQWTLMSKLPAGSAPATLDWRWQKISAQRVVKTEDEFRCINCHTFCGEPPDGYSGTCAVP